MTPRGAPLGTRLKLLSDEDEFGCWLWNASTSSDGYARIKVDGKMVAAHRMAYATWVGPIPEGMTVDHLCFVTSCVNPTHLQLLTVSENSRRQRRLMALTCKRGHLLEGDSRRCRTCVRANQLRRWHEKGLAAKRRERRRLAREGVAA